MVKAEASVEKTSHWALMLRLCSTALAPFRGSANADAAIEDAVGRSLDFISHCIEVHSALAAITAEE